MKPPYRGCTLHLPRFHYLPFPTSNVMTSLFLLPKGSNFHFRQHISYISFGNHGQLDHFPLFSNKSPALSQAESQTLVSALQAGNPWPKLSSTVRVAHLTWK